MLVVGTRQLLQQLETCPNINSLGESLKPTQAVKDLGLIFDYNLTYNDLFIYSIYRRRAYPN